MADKKLPKELIKYYACNKNSYDALINNYLWAANPLSFNDPFDCAIQFWNIDNFPRDFVIDQLKELDPKVDHTQKSIFTLREEYFTTLLQIIGVCCLNAGGNEDLFWGYYNNHEGFTIAFNTSKLNEASGLPPQKVNYISVCRLRKEKAIFSDNRIVNTRSLSHWLVTKKEDWVHENEYRYILQLDPNKSEPRKIDYPKSAINKVVFGFKFFQSSSQVYLKKGIYKHDFSIKDDGENNKINFNLEILRFLREQSDFCLFQVALQEDLTIYHQRIYIKEVNKNTVTIFRDFPPEQLSEMDSEN